MSLELSPEHEAIVREELATGEYQSEADVVLRALKLLKQLRVHELREKIRIGLEELDRGEGIELNGPEELRAFFDDIIARGRERLESSTDGG